MTADLTGPGPSGHPTVTPSEFRTIILNVLCNASLNDIELPEPDLTFCISFADGVISANRGSVSRFARITRWVAAEMEKRETQRVVH
jgi:protein-tyrosine phosphatase